MYLLHAVREQATRLRFSAQGSVFDTITRATFATIDVIWPPTSVLQAFEEQLRPFFSMILANAQQSMTLAALRDTLLPRLVAGERRLSEIERIIGEAV